MRRRRWDLAEPRLARLYRALCRPRCRNGGRRATGDLQLLVEALTAPAAVTNLAELFLQPEAGDGNTIAISA